MTAANGGPSGEVIEMRGASTPPVKAGRLHWTDTPPPNVRWLRPPPPPTPKPDRRAEGSHPLRNGSHPDPHRQGGGESKGQDDVRRRASGPRVR